MASRTPRDRCGLVFLPRDARGRTLSVNPLPRFAEKCRFDAATGCVVWTGGTTAGRGNTTRYGSFWYAGRRWYAHRWAAVYIHGLNVGTDEVGHVCPHGPNSLCVQHLSPTTKAANIAERNTRVAAAARGVQASINRQFWLLVDRGYEQAPEPPAIDRDDLPWFDAPDWLRPFMPDEELTMTDNLDNPHWVGEEADPHWSGEDACEIPDWAGVEACKVLNVAFGADAYVWPTHRNSLPVVRFASDLMTKRGAAADPLREAVRAAVIVAQPYVLESADFNKSARSDGRVKGDVFIDRLVANLRARGVELVTAASE